MFSLTVLDHIRLESEHVARNYTVHAAAADRLARFAFAARIVVLVLLAAAAAATTANLLLPDRFYQVTAVAATGLAVLCFALYTTISFESRVSAHRNFAHRLWLVCAEYRSLIAEATDGLVDGPVLLQRRDRLTTTLHAIYEREFAADQRAFEALRLPELPAKNAA